MITTLSSGRGSAENATSHHERWQETLEGYPTGGSTGTPMPESTSDWQSVAVEAYRDAVNHAPSDLAARLAALTGRWIDPEDVFVDRAAGLSVAVVDGVLFRLRRKDLVVVRRCGHCGVNQFESPPIDTLDDLGYALSTWQPYCRDCEPDDPADSD